jgi:hypothetical protein
MLSLTYFQCHVSKFVATNATSHSLAKSEVETEKIQEQNANALFDSTMKSQQVVFEFVDRAFKSVKSIVRICCLKCIYVCVPCACKYVCMYMCIRASVHILYKCVVMQVCTCACVCVLTSLPLLFFNMKQGENNKTVEEETSTRQKDNKEVCIQICVGLRVC